MVWLRQADQRQADARPDQPEPTERPLGRYRVRFQEERSVQTRQPLVEFPRPRLVVEQGGLDHLAHEPRRDVAGDRDDALRTGADQLAAAGVVAREQQEVVAAALEYLAAARNIAGRLLDADDLRVTRQALDSLRQQVAGRARG